MDIIYYSATVFLLLFMLLATYDGFYLHIFKYKLFNHSESIFEHKTHTIRAVLFPLIVWFLFINETDFNTFLLGCLLVLVDMFVLAIDAFSEKESRSFMGGLPKWEYIIHLFSNAFHFAGITLILVVKWNIFNSAFIFDDSLISSTSKDIFELVSVNMIPGAIILAVLHILLLHSKIKSKWNFYIAKITCC